MIDKVIPRQLFEVPIQAVAGKKVLARETLSAIRSDVTAGLYGGECESSPSLPETVVLPPQLNLVGSLFCVVACRTL